MGIGESVAAALEDWLHVFQAKSTAGWLFLILVTATLVLAIAYHRISIAQPLRALRAAQRSLSSLSFVGGENAERAGQEAEERLDAALAAAAARSPVGGRILLAWRRRNAALKAGSVRGEEPVLRPQAVLGPQPRWLGTAADALVGTGLVMTFLGLVAAIGAASSAVTAAVDPRDALVGLLGAASVKFLSSIAGIGGSLVLRVWQAFWLAQVAQACAMVSGAVDAHLLRPGSALRPLAPGAGFAAPQPAAASSSAS
jgi:hypothetical protein